MKKCHSPWMVQDIMKLVVHFRILSLLVRGFHTLLEERHLSARRTFCQLYFLAVAGLATIAVESLNSFLQRKRNKAMASGMMAIKQDQSLAWNSLKQLENDFLLYGKYNVAQMQDIVSTVNGLQNRSIHLGKTCGQAKICTHYRLHTWLQMSQAGWHLCINWIYMYTVCLKDKSDCMNGF